MTCKGTLHTVKNKQKTNYTGISGVVLLLGFILGVLDDDDDDDF